MHVVRREGVLEDLCRGGKSSLAIPELPGDMGVDVRQVGKLLGGGVRIQAILRVK
jgi:hypothetical protein